MEESYSQTQQPIQQSKKSSKTWIFIIIFIVLIIAGVLSYFLFFFEKGTGVGSETCIDTDGGSNFYVKGSVSGPHARLCEDTCVEMPNGDINIKECYCMAEGSASSTVPCPDGEECKEGTCVESQVEIETVTQDDIVILEGLRLDYFRCLENVDEMDCPANTENFVKCMDKTQKAACANTLAKAAAEAFEVQTVADYNKKIKEIQDNVNDDIKNAWDCSQYPYKDGECKTAPLESEDGAKPWYVKYNCLNSCWDGLI